MTIDEKVLAELLDDPNKHQLAARRMATLGWSNERVAKFLDSINFYPNEKFYQWVSNRRSEVEAAEKINKALGMRFF